MGSSCKPVLHGVTASEDDEHAPLKLLVVVLISKEMLPVQMFMMPLVRSYYSMP